MCEKQHEQKVRDILQLETSQLHLFQLAEDFRSGRIASNQKPFWSHDFMKHSPSVGQENVPGRIQLISSSRFQISILKLVCGLSGVSQMVTNGFKGEKCTAHKHIGLYSLSAFHQAPFYTSGYNKTRNTMRLLLRRKENTR